MNRASRFAGTFPKRGFLTGLITLGLAFLLPLVSYGATYYASPSGSGSTCSASSRCSLATAQSKLSGGDTLILGDGTYSTTIANTPSGTSGAYTIIKSENDGGAIVQSTNSTRPLQIGGSYIQVEGIKFVSNVSGSNTDAAWITGSRNKIFRSAFVTTPNSDAGNNTSNVIISGTYNLMEDCWAWGGGRYKFLIYGGNAANGSEGHHNILRRCVGRHDRDNSSLGEAIFTSYSGRDNLFQNCIGLNSDQNPYYNTGYWHGMFFLEKGYSGAGSAVASGPITIRGSIGINISAPFLLETNATYYNSQDRTITVTDSIGWNNSGGLQFGYYNATGHIDTINHVTFGNVTDTSGGEAGQGAGFRAGVTAASTGSTSKNSLYYNMETGLYNVRGTNTYNSFYSVDINLAGSSTASNSVANVNPLTGSLKYLPRIETGSPLKGAGSAGSDIGANVLYKWGTSGTLWGETGYDTVTSEPLWPWTNEARIKADMGSYPSNWPAGNLPNPVRGFTAGTSKDGSSQTLTKYIWEYLGNQIPADIYGAGPAPGTQPDTSAPAVTAFTVPGNSTSLTFSVSSFTASDNTGVTGYLITESSAAPAAGAAGWSATAPASFTVATVGSHTLYGWAKDAAGNVSLPLSATITVSTPVADTTAPVITSFLIPTTSTSLTVPVSVLGATDNVAVSGYCVTTVNSSTGCAWSAAAPTNVTFAAAGTQSAYAWAKDASGNVSTAVTDAVTITLSQTGNIYYVRPDGHDSASGKGNTSNTSTGAWLTLQHAANLVAAGDTVYVADGNYAGFMLRASGTSSMPITFQAIGTGANIISRNATTSDGINIESYSSILPSYIVIDGFNVSNQPRMGIRVIGGTGVVIKNNTVRNSLDCGIFSGNTPSIQVLDNTTYNNGTTGLQHNIYVSNAASDNCVIRGNIVYGANGGNGIQVNGDYLEGGDGYIDNAIIEDNIVYSNRQKGLSLISIRYATVQNNVIYNNGTSAGGIHIVDQQGSHYSINNMVVNNTIDEPSIAAVRINSGSTGNTVFNNICIGSTGIVFEGSGNYQSNNYSSTGGSGIFANYAGHDYRLSAASPAIGYGLATYQSDTPPALDIIGTTRPQNGVIDAGAYEYISATDTSKPVVTSFAVATSSTSLTVPITSFAATDNVGVTGYLVTESATAPTAGAAGWSASVPASYTFSGSGARTAYAWAKDAAGNVSNSLSDSLTITVPDATVPTVSLTSPANNATLSATAAITASASDNVGVTMVEFYLNGSLLAATNVAPYALNWDTTAYANGSYTLNAKAYDAAGNVAQSSNVSVTVNNPVPDTAAPTVSVTAPANGATVSGTVAVSAGATDNVGVTKVEFYLNGVLQTTLASSPYSFSWNTAAVANGVYVISAKAYDAAGNVGQSASVTVTVSNDTTAPVVSIASPVTNSTVAGTVLVSANASDNVGVTKVEFFVNGTLRTTDISAPYSFSWDTTAVANGAYTISAKAYDAAGKVGQSLSSSVTVNNLVAPTAKAIAFVQVAYATPQTPTQAVTVAYPRTQTAGNMNIVVVGWNDTTSSVQSVNDSAGNVYTLAAGPISGTGLRQSIYYAKGIKGGSTSVTVTFNAKANYPDIRILEYAGVSTLDKTAGKSGNSSTCSSGSVTTTAAKGLIFSANTVATMTRRAGTGFTKRTITSPDGDIAQDRIVSSVGTYTASAPLSYPGPWVMQTVAFK